MTHRLHTEITVKQKTNKNNKTSCEINWAIRECIKPNSRVPSEENPVCIGDGDNKYYMKTACNVNDRTSRSTASLQCFSVTHCQRYGLAVRAFAARRLAVYRRAVFFILGQIIEKNILHIMSKFQFNHAGF